MSKPTSNFTVQSHFEGKDPNVRLIYDQLRKTFKKFGPFTEEPKKTSIHLVNATAFAGVATRKSYLLLNIKGDRPIKSARIQKSERVSAHRYHHEVKLVSAAEVDEELIGWLQQAYVLSE